MKKRTVLTSLVTLAVGGSLALGAVGCQPKQISQPQIAPDPFTAVWEPGDEHYVTFSGNSAGHLAGEESGFTLKLDNNSFEPWKVEYLVQLLDTDSIVMEIAHDTTNVPSGLESQIDIPVVFDEDLDGPYGLSLYIPTFEAQSLQTIWIGDKEPLDAGTWPSIANHPWLWPENTSDDKDETSIDEAMQELAKQFVTNCPTFVFDGIPDSLKLTDIVTHSGGVSDKTVEELVGWEFTYEFDSRHGGYGDRAGQIVLQVITHHNVVIKIENGEIVSAVMDGKWDMMAQKLSESE